MPGERPVPATRPAPALLTPSTVEPAALTIGRAKASAGVVTMRLRLPRAGRVRQRGTALIGGAMHTACTTKATRATSGELTLRCRLKPAAKRRLRSRSLRLRLRTWFAPAQGRPTTVIHKVTVPRR